MPGEDEQGLPVSGVVSSGVIVLPDDREDTKRWLSFGHIKLVATGRDLPPVAHKAKAKAKAK